MPPNDAPARPAQVVKALAMLAGNVDLWEAGGRAHTLDLFLRCRAEGLPHPLRHLRQYREFGDTVEDAATVLRLGWQPPGDDDPPYLALEEATLAHEFASLGEGFLA